MAKKVGKDTQERGPRKEAESGKKQESLLIKILRWYKLLLDVVRFLSSLLLLVAPMIAIALGLPFSFDDVVMSILIAAYAVLLVCFEFTQLMYTGMLELLLYEYFKLIFLPVGYGIVATIICIASLTLNLVGDVAILRLVIVILFFIISISYIIGGIFFSSIFRFWTPEDLLRLRYFERRILALQQVGVSQSSAVVQNSNLTIPAPAPAPATKEKRSKPSGANDRLGSPSKANGKSEEQKESPNEQIGMYVPPPEARL